MFLSLQNPQDNIITLYHASTIPVEKPKWDYTPSKEKRDFGVGFYTSREIEYPIMPYSDNDTVILNQYLLDTSVLNILVLENNIHWLLAVGFSRRDFKNYPEYHAIRDRYRKWLTNYDLIIGTISNDYFFSSIENFLDGVMSDYVALNLAQMMRYGTQYVMKSDKACNSLAFQYSWQVETPFLHRLRDQRKKEKSDMGALVLAERRKLQRQDTGRYIDEIIMEMRNNDKLPF